MTGSGFLSAMAECSFQFIGILVLGLSCLAEGNLTAPNKVTLPVGETIRVTCAYTQDDADDVCLRWNQPPTEHVNYTEAHNTTGRFLTMEVRAVEEFTRTFTCTARGMNGNKIGEASTVFVSCPKEELECGIQESVEGCKFEPMCRYIPRCFTALRCKLANRLLNFPGLTKERGWYTTKYCENGTLGADNVLCYLYSDTLPAHLQTRVVIPLPSTLTTPAASTAEPATPQLSPQPPDSPDNCKDTPTCNDKWPLCFLTFLATIPIVVAAFVLICDKCIKKSQPQPL